MTIQAKVRTLRARASQSADLSFNMAGVIAARNYDFATDNGTAHLGKVALRFDIKTNLYDHLGETEPGSGPIIANSRLKYGAGSIAQLFISPKGSNPAPYLFELRNETLGAALDQAISKRENAYLERYRHVAQIAARLRHSYPEITKHLTNLVANTQARFDALDAEYATDGIAVRKATVSEQSVSADYAVQTENVTKSTTLATWNSTMPNGNPSGDAMITEIKDPDGKVLQKHETPNAGSLPRILNAAGQWELVSTPDFTSQKVEAKTTSDGKQITETFDARYAHPRLENEIEYRQASQALHSELIKQELATHRLPHLERIMENELKAIDLEIRSLQLNFAHTYLTAPFDGVVTALYKDIGESVEAGEPILRLENDTVLLIVGQVQAVGSVRLGAQVTITFDLDDTGAMKQLPGHIVSVRGHEADNDEWDLIIQADNPADGGGRLVPLNYQFDPDSSVVVIM